MSLISNPFFSTTVLPGLLNTIITSCCSAQIPPFSDLSNKSVWLLGTTQKPQPWYTSLTSCTGTFSCVLVSTFLLHSFLSPVCNVVDRMHNRGTKDREPTASWFQVSNFVLWSSPGRGIPELAWKAELVLVFSKPMLYHPNSSLSLGAKYWNRYERKKWRKNH